jgi:hypothetical protein
LDVGLEELGADDSFAERLGRLGVDDDLVDDPEVGREYFSFGVISRSCGGAVEYLEEGRVEIFEPSPRSTFDR